MRVQRRMFLMNKTLTLSLIALLAVSPLAFGQQTGKSAGNAKLEKELWKVDQQWLEAARNKKLDVLQKLWTSQFFEINSGGTVPDKAEQLDRVANGKAPEKRVVTPDEFKLRAVYGNFALATDRTILKGIVYKGRDFSGQYRVLRMFVKENGEWKVAGAALCPIITP